MIDPVGALGKPPIRLVHQPAVHVAEAVLIGYQLDEAVVAVRVDDADVLGRVRAPAPPDFLVPLVGEGVLGVEL